MRVAWGHRTLCREVHKAMHTCVPAEVNRAPYLKFTWEVHSRRALSSSLPGEVAKALY